ncbi:unnamed protein product [Alternaria alternata]
MSDAKEDAVRLQGVAWIDQVRRALQLPIRTFNTAVIYYHKFRLLHADNEYNWADAAAAALFTACKIEDTLKKSREILCAHWNLKVGPGESLSSDDPRFENHSKLIIGLERLMLESAGFDFRNRYPQKVMVKLARALRFDAKDEAKTTWNLSIDSYRTFAPLKQSTPTLAIACLELAARLHGKDTTKFVDAGPVRYSKWATSRAEIMETLLDLLDLYTHHRSATSVGPSYTLEHFINIRIGLNQEASAANIPRYSRYKSESVADAGSTTNGAKPRNGIDPTSPFTPATPIAHSPAADQAPKSAIGIRGQNGTVRFMLDAARAHDERAEVEKFHKLEEEEYEVEVPISSESRTDDRERERARVGRDFISVANDEKSSAGIGHTEDYWNKFRKRSKVASDSEPASRTDGNVHTSRRAVKLDNVSDKGNVQRRADDHVNVSFDDGESNDRGRGRDSRKRPRLQDRKKRGDIYRSKITQHRESSSERLPPRLSMSSHGEADHELPKDEKNYRKQQVSSFRIACQLSRQQENYLHLQNPKQVKNDFRKETSIKNKDPVQITHCPRTTDINGQTLVTTMETTEEEEGEGEEREAVGVAGGTTTVMVEAEVVALERGTRGLTALFGLLGLLEEGHGMS